MSVQILSQLVAVFTVTSKTLEFLLPQVHSSVQLNATLEYEFMTANSTLIIFLVVAVAVVPPATWCAALL